MVSKNRKSALKRRERYRISQLPSQSAPQSDPHNRICTEPPRRGSKRKADHDYYQRHRQAKIRKVLDHYYANRASLKNEAARRYHNNPTALKEKALRRYHNNPAVLKEKALRRYHDNPSAFKEKWRRRYQTNPTALKEKALRRYHNDPTPLKQKALCRYHNHPAALKEKALRRYHNNPAALKEKAVRRYHNNPAAFKEKWRRRYHSNPSALKDKALRRYHKERSHCKQSFHRYYKANRADLKGKAVERYREQLHSLEAARDICRDGSERRKASLSRRARKIPSFLKRNTSRKDVLRLVSHIQGTENLGDRLIRAEDLLKWATEFRRLAVNKLKRAVQLWKAVSCKILVAIQPFNDAHFLEDLSPILGPSLHTVTTEPYYADAAHYQALTDGRPVVALRDSTTNTTTENTWQCNATLCVINKVQCVQRLRNISTLVIQTSLEHFPSLMRRMDLCTSSARDPNKAGHPLPCYTDGHCPSNLLFLRTIAPHFPRVRTILKYFYSINSGVREFQEVDAAIYSCNVQYLEGVRQKMISQTGKTYTLGASQFKCEDDIIETYRTAFAKLKTTMSDTPTIPCMSCEKLYLRSQVHSLTMVRSKPTCEMWNALLQFCASKNIPTEFICRTCLSKFRSGSMPSACLLNNLFVRPTPPDITTLNQFEKLLIQRAKCFQVVVRMGTVSKRHQPAIHSLEKAVGRAFHLPLPLEQTLKTIPHPDHSLPNELGLYILVRGVPTKNKKIWQSMVDVKKVHSALVWLKHNNPLYTSINLGSVLQLDDYMNDNILVLESEEQGDVDEQAEPSLLTKMSAADEYYEQYTICDLVESRPNATASDLYQMRKTEASPLRSFEDKLIDVKCFPDLYPFGDDGLHAEREHSLTPSEFGKLRLLSRHSQFRLNHQYIFFLMHEMDVRAVQSGIYHKQNVIRTTNKLTAATCTSAIEKGELEQDLTVLFTRLRNSSQFWQRPRSDVETMILYYGPVTFFLTLSPSEFRWDDLNVYLSTVNGVQPGLKSTSALVAIDPVSTSRFIDHKFKALLDFITSDEHPLGEVIHYAWRREYQTRGLQHFHTLLWVKNAPIIGESSTDYIAQFIMSYITCSLPDPKLFPTLFQQVTQYQKHHHNDYCMRRKTTKSGIKSVCRFGFPRNVTESFKLRGVAESIAGRRHLKSSSRLYDLPRTDDEQYINDYNPAVLLAWDGNMDVQYIGETSCALSKYVTKYQTKSEKSNFSDWESIQRHQSLSKTLWNIGMRGLNSRECGIMEASDAVMGMPLFGTDPDTIIKWVDVSMVRKRRVRPKKDLKICDPDSTDIYFPALVDTHYPARPLEMEDTSLFDFAANYDIVKVKPTSGATTCYDYPPHGFIRRRRNRCLVKHHIFNINQHPEQYFFSMLLLFRPWRDISDLKDGFSTYAEAFHFHLDIMNTEMERHHLRLEHLRRSKEEIDTIVRRLREEARTEKPNDRHLDEDHHHVNTMAQVTASDIQNMVNQLNTD